MLEEALRFAEHVDVEVVGAFELTGERKRDHKLASISLFLGTAAMTLPACPFRKADDGGAPDVAKPTKNPEQSLVKPSGPVIVATGHPRLFVRDVDIPRLRSWASSDNPMFEKGLKPLVVRRRYHRPSLHPLSQGARVSVLQRRVSGSRADQADGANLQPHAAT